MAISRNVMGEWRFPLDLQYIIVRYLDLCISVCVCVLRWGCWQCVWSGWSGISRGEAAAKECTSGKGTRKRVSILGQFSATAGPQTFGALSTSSCAYEMLPLQSKKKKQAHTHAIRTVKQENMPLQWDCTLSNSPTSYTIGVSSEHSCNGSWWVSCLEVMNSTSKF